LNALSPLWLTLKVAAGSTLLSGALALPLARRYRRRRVAALESALLLPLVLPPTTLGYYLLLVLGRQSALGRFLQDRLGWQLVFDWKGAVVAAACVSFPIFYKAAQTAFAAVDPRWEEAARLLGASEWRVLGRVTLPSAAAGLLSAAVLAFARSVGDFGATLLVAGNIPGKTQTLSIAIYDALSAGDDGRAMALVALTTGLAYAALLAAHLSLPRRWS
jgi:molybdate transport system permease protein